MDLTICQNNMLVFHDYIILTLFPWKTIHDHVKILRMVVFHDYFEAGHRLLPRDSPFVGALRHAPQAPEECLFGNLWKLSAIFSFIIIIG